MEFDWQVSLSLQAAPDFVFAFLGLSGVLGEVLFGLVLISRKARIVLPLAMAGMHVGIIFLQNILFFDLILLQAIFFDWTKIRHWFGERLAQLRPPLYVLYDGTCELCLRTVRILRGLDLFDRLNPVDFHTLDLQAFNQQQGTTIGSRDLDREMYVVSDGLARAGLDGYRRMARELPILWGPGLLLSLPLVSRIGRRVYATVATQRKSLIACDRTCEPEIAVPAPAATSQFVHTVCAFSTLGLLGLLVFCWGFRIEYYPFTTMQMYSALNKSGQVEYIKVLAHFNDGSISETKFEWIGAMADSRYRRVISDAFGSEDAQERASKFLDASLARANLAPSPGRAVRFFEIQKWKWDFRREPNSATHGHPVQSLVYPSPAN